MGTELIHSDIVLMEYYNIFVLAVCPGKQSLRNGAGNLLRNWFRKLQWKHKDSDTQKEEKSIKCIKQLVSSADAWGPFPLEAHEETVWIECQNLRACSCHFSRVWIFAILWTVTLHTLLSMGFSRQEYWSGLQFPSPGDLTDPGIEPGSHALQADFLPSELPGKFQMVKVNSFLH